MKVDDPTIPEFASWRSYHIFAERVRHSRRYILGGEVQMFLDTVLATRNSREMKIPKGSVFYRAQRGIEYTQTGLCA